MLKGGFVPLSCLLSMAQRTTAPSPFRFLWFRAACTRSAKNAAWAEDFMPPFSARSGYSCKSQQELGVEILDDRAAFYLEFTWRAWKAALFFVEIFKSQSFSS
ncbi:MAG: hypothetical protein P8L68_00235 [Paracoccaceae bacterium]|nr:hypothetical protein [Paracoccaceae bacterium]